MGCLFGSTSDALPMERSAQGGWRPRMGRLTATLLFAAFIIAAILFIVAAWWAVNWWERPLSVARPITLTIEPGATVSIVAHKLRKAGLVRHECLLPWAMRVRGEARALKAGEYAVVPGQSLGELMASFVAGDVVRHEFRIAEGVRIKDVLLALRTESNLEWTLDGATAETLLANLGLRVGVEDAAIRPGQALTGRSASGWRSGNEGVILDHAEGWFFPETYHYTAGEQDRSLLLRAHAKMVVELERAWLMRVLDLPYQTPYEVLIAASLIEKETSRAEDRRHVSQVLAARLRRNMRLQMDPTVIYGLGDEFDGDITRRQLRQPTPYNTYVHKGLPPTPIALPSQQALMAVVAPSGAPYLYFVARGDGSTKFSETLAEHNAAVRRHQFNR